MMFPSNNCIHPFFTGSLLSLLLSLSTGAWANTEKEWRFKVYLDDKEIGYHHFQLVKTGREEKITTRAKFDVTFLKIPLFKYRHENTEYWYDRCLARIRSSTDENGKQFEVRGSGNDETFLLFTESGDENLPSCVSTYAYWDKSFLSRKRLLNSQTGEYSDVSVDYLGTQAIDVRDTRTTAHRYRLITDKASIDLWYSENDQWLSLQSTIRGGRILRYHME